jgi:hypothetical protein
MLDTVAAQKEELLARPDHQRLDELEAARASRLDQPRHSEAPERKSGPAHEREHQKQRREIPPDVDEIHGRHLIASTLIGG